MSYNTSYGSRSTPQIIGFSASLTSLASGLQEVILILRKIGWSWSEVAKRPETRWWLEAGTELCSACDQLYLYETEYRCADCDGPRCRDCVQVRQSLTVCLTCFDCSGQEVEVQ